MKNNSKLIGIDGNEANVEKRVGSNVYAFQILNNIWQLENNKRKNKRSGLRFKIYLKNKPLTDLPEEKDWWQYRLLKAKKLWTQWRLPLDLYLFSPRPDLFFSPGHYGPRFCPSPLAIAIMDLAFLRFPNQFKKEDLYQLINWTNYSVKKASHIFTISKASKKEIVDYYHYPENQISLTYPAVKDYQFKDKEVKKTFNRLAGDYKIEPSSYFLYIGTLQPRKNLGRLIDAFYKFKKKADFKKMKLIIGGKKGWLYKDIFAKVQKLNLVREVVFPGFVSEIEKTALLKNAFCFVFPSLYEGFGIPLVEAMKFSCPVVSSKTSSLPEVAGRAAVYIKNPQIVGSIYQSMVKMVKLKPSKRKELIEQGQIQVKKFSWKQSAAKVLQVLKKLSEE